MKKKMAVIGGSAAGHEIAYKMREAMDVTLIDPKTYWEVPMALLRLLVQPDALPARMVFKDFLPGVRHVKGKAVRMSDHDVTVDVGGDRDVVALDYASIATGSRYLDPLIKAENTTDRERADEIAGAHSQLAAARNVVVGGGPVGVEVAAEIRETFPATAVTLVHAHGKVLDHAPSRFGGWAQTSLKKAGVTIVLNDMVVSPQIGN